MQPKLPASLQPIYDLELVLGNRVVQVREASHPAIPLTVVFQEPLHRAEVEARLQLVSPVKWYGLGAFSGYVSEDTRESLQGPTPPIAEVMRIAEPKLSQNLRAIYDLELSFGNTVVRVDEPAGSLCPLAINFKNPLHKTEIASRLPLPASVRWWENHDRHYPIEGGYGCEETSHVIAGPLGPLR